MSVELNHTIVPARDKHASAAFLSHILGVPMSPEVASLTRRSAPTGRSHRTTVPAGRPQLSCLRGCAQEMQPLKRAGATRPISNAGNTGPSSRIT